VNILNDQSLRRPAKRASAFRCIKATTDGHATVGRLCCLSGKEPKRMLADYEEWSTAGNNQVGGPIHKENLQQFLS